MPSTTKGIFDVKIWEDIEECCNSENLTAVIENRVKLFYPINTENAIRWLTQVGHLLQLSYAGSKCCGPCSVHVIEAYIHYQDLAKNTVTICTTFTNVVLKSLSFHKPAFMFAEKEKPNKSIGFLGKCSSLAGKMADGCDKMVVEIEKLSHSSLNAFTMVTEKYVGTETEMQEINERANKLSVYLEAAMQKVNHLKEEVEKARMEEAKNKEEGKKNLGDRLIVGLLGPISYIATNMEIKSNELKLILQKEARKVNDDLTESIECLKQIDYAKSELHISIVCLEVSIKILEKVKIMFLNGKQFWSGVKHHVDSLGSSKSVSALRDTDVFEACKDAFINEITTSGLGWLATGKICRQAALNIRGACAVAQIVDRTNTKLFEKTECAKFIQELCNVLLHEIVEENEKIEDVKSDWLYEVLVKASAAVNLSESEQVPEEAPFNYLVVNTGEK